MRIWGTVFSSNVTLGAIAQACVEAVGVEPGIEHDPAIALALRPALAAGEKPRADAFKPPICHDRHLPELHRLAVERLHRNRSDHGAARGRGPAEKEQTRKRARRAAA